MSRDGNARGATETRSPPRASLGLPAEVFIVALSGLALGVRVAALLTTYDAPGDGPTRALEAYQWSIHPLLPTSGVWPPGFLLLNGPANWVVPLPILTSRLVNVVLGTLTIPALFLFAERGFGTTAALVGAVGLALWPLHVELSASSLSEAGFLFELLAGLWLLDAGLDRNGRLWQICIGVALVVLASMTRYEAWWFLPILPVYVGWRRRRLRAAAIAGGVLLAFPGAWLLGNCVLRGDTLIGFTAALKGAEVEGATAVGFADALSRLASVAADDAGWPLTLTLPVGAILAIFRLRRNQPAGVLHAGVALTFWGAMLYFACLRGSSLYSRYLLLGLVLTLPMACAPFQIVSARARGWVGAALIAAVLGSFLGTGRFSSDRWLTHRAPTEIEDVAEWLASRSPRPRFVLLTDMGWQASYLAVHRPDLADRIAIVSDWMTDETLTRLFAELHPTLVVTSDRDIEQFSRVEKELGVSVTSLPLLHSAGEVQVRDLAALTRPRPSAGMSRPCTGVQSGCTPRE